jgi:hypothetical protein
MAKHDDLMEHAQVPFADLTPKGKIKFNRYRNLEKMQAMQKKNGKDLKQETLDEMALLEEELIDIIAEISDKKEHPDTDDDNNPGEDDNNPVSDNDKGITDFIFE